MCAAETQREMKCLLLGATAHDYQTVQQRPGMYYSENSLQMAPADIQIMFILIYKMQRT